MPSKGSGGERVLLVDDDTRLLDVLAQTLALEGFDVGTARDAGEAISAIELSGYDVIILDVMMPTVDGLTLCRLIRDRIDSPILMLTALDSVTDKVAGLESGADDYLTKPFATDELVARIRVLLRRTRRNRTLPATPLEFAGVRLDSALWQATRDGKPLDLTSLEFRILSTLVASPRRVFTREEILGLAWRHDEGNESNVVDVHIASLRQKLEAGGSSRLIQTVRGVGYTVRDA
jgi:two-component system, OmpR family, response regulator MprA